MIFWLLVLKLEISYYRVINLNLLNLRCKKAFCSYCIMIYYVAIYDILYLSLCFPLGLRINKTHWWKHFQNVGLVNLATTLVLALYLGNVPMLTPFPYM
jgi:hypothetical protein